MDALPSFILFLLSIYSQVGPGLGFPAYNSIPSDAHDSMRLGRHLLEESTTETPSVEEQGFFAEVSEFYSDKNNMAMYLVLPIIVLLYGGCSAIYCVAKCRRYLRKKKHQKLSRPEDEEQLTENEPNNLNQEGGNDNPRNTTENNFNTSATDVSLGMDREKSTPLPWQVPDDDTTTAMVHPLTTSRTDPDHLKAKNKLPPIQRPPIPMTQLSKSVDGEEVPRRALPPTQKPYTSQGVTPIDEPTLSRNIESSGEKSRSRSSNNDLIDAAVRGSPSGRESVSTIAVKDELLARFDAFSTFAMAKKAADILRYNSLGGDKKDYIKPKNKLIFIAE